MGRPLGSKNKKHIELVEYTCPFCGKIFTKFPSYNKGRNSLVYCSREHSDANRKNVWKKFGAETSQWKGGIGSYRQRAFREYGKKCIECGYDKYEHLLWVHHKDFKRKNHELSNLEVLCIRCHLEKHLCLSDPKLK